MKRLTILAVVFVALIAVYIGLRTLNKPAPFVAPDAVRLEQVKSDDIDGITLLFAQEKQVNLSKHDGHWFVADHPADNAKVQQLIDALAKTSVASRASSNKQYHERFDVGEKGVRMILSEKGNVLKEVILGKAAGGDTVYVRLPDADDVYVMNGLPRYSLTEDENSWRDHKVATFESSAMRRVSYGENQIQWDLRKDKDGWKLSTNRIAAVSTDAAKTDTYLSKITGLRAVDFPTEEAVAAAKKNHATFAKVDIELGTVDTFDRKETWLVYTDTENDRLLLVREADSQGIYVNKDSFGQAFSDYAQTLTSVTLTAAEKAAKEQTATANTGNK